MEKTCAEIKEKLDPVLSTALLNLSITEDPTLMKKGEVVTLKVIMDDMINKFRNILSAYLDVLWNNRLYEKISYKLLNTTIHSVWLSSNIL